MAEDQQKLSSLNAQLAMLKAREKSIEYDYETNLDDVIARLNKEKENSNTENVEIKTAEKIVEPEPIKVEIQEPKIEKQEEPNKQPQTLNDLINRNNGF